MSTPLSLISKENTTHSLSFSLLQKSSILSKSSQTTVEIDSRSEIIEKIIEFYKHYEASDPRPIVKPLPSSNLQDHIPAWDFAFIELDVEILLELTQASQSLKLQGLVDLCCAKLASLIRDKSPEEIKELFSIKDE